MKEMEREDMSSEEYKDMLARFQVILFLIICPVVL